MSLSELIFLNYRPYFIFSSNVEGFKLRINPTGAGGELPQKSHWENCLKNQKYRKMLLFESYFFYCPIKKILHLVG